MNKEICFNLVKALLIIIFGMTKCCFLLVRKQMIAQTCKTGLSLLKWNFNQFCAPSVGTVKLIFYAISAVVVKPKVKTLKIRAWFRTNFSDILALHIRISLRNL